MTPFQNQVLDFAQKKEAEEKERQREEAKSGGDVGQRNARSGGKSAGSPQTAGMEQEETVRYVNKDLNPDHEVHESN